MLKFRHPVDAIGPEKLARLVRDGEPLGFHAVGDDPKQPPRFTVTMVPGGARVTHADGRHIGSYADTGVAIAAGATALGGTLE